MTKAIHSETLGKGAHVILLHGWGLHSAIWSKMAKRLAKRFCVSVVDLPGYGKSPVAKDFCSDFEYISTLVADHVPKPGLWIGWSLGGMMATFVAATKPQHVTGLITVASNAKFAADAQWPHGVASETLQAFAEQLENDYHGTLNRFLALQMRGSEKQFEQLRTLRQHLRAAGSPRREAVRGGLNMLLNTDLRPYLGRIRCPSRQFYGENDPLVPQSAARNHAWLYPGLEPVMFKGAGHAPFLSHSDHFIKAVNQFYDECIQHREIQ